MSIDLATIKARLAVATAGPWNAEVEHTSARSNKPGWYIVWGKHGVVCRTGATNMPNAEEDAAFIAHAPADIAALIAEVERLMNTHAVLQGRVRAFGGQLQAWGFDAAAQELHTEILDGDMHTPDYDRLTLLADAAAAWSAAVAEPNGVDDAEKALLAAVKAWQQTTSA